MHKYMSCRILCEYVYLNSPVFKFWAKTKIYCTRLGILNTAVDYS